jgi:type I restriction enzyme S subunit
MINPSRPNGFTRLPDAPTTFAPMAAVDGNLGVISKPESRSYSEVSKGYTYFGEADVLFAKITPCMQNGKHAIARNLLDGVGFGSTEFHVIRPSALILPEWIHFFIRQPFFLQEAASYFVGAVGQQRVPESFLANYGIPLPPLPEQKRIATKVQELTKDVQRARLACEAQLEAARALPQAYLRQVFESEEAKKWERGRLGQVCDGDSGVWGDIPDNSQNCYVVLRSNNIQEGLIVLDDLSIRKVIDPNVVEAKSLRTGDILVTTSSGSKNLLGKSALFVQPLDGKKYLFSNFTMRLRPNTQAIEPTFLYFYLRSPQAKQVLMLLQDTTTGLRNLDRKEFIAQTIPVPTLAKQEQIAAELRGKIASAEKLKESIEKQLESIKALPQAILRKAFRGEL